MADGEQISGSNDDETLKADPQASSPPSPWARPAEPQAWQTTPAPTAWGWPQADPIQQRTAPGPLPDCHHPGGHLADGHHAGRELAVATTPVAL